MNSNSPSNLGFLKTVPANYAKHSYLIMDLHRIFYLILFILLLYMIIFCFFVNRCKYALSINPIPYGLFLGLIQYGGGLYSPPPY